MPRRNVHEDDIVGMEDEETFDEEAQPSGESLNDLPLRIIRISEDGTHFELVQENLEALRVQVEKTGASRVSIISVVGAFRTGKSFLLSAFLRYLRYCDKNGVPLGEEGDCKWLKSGETHFLTGNKLADQPEPGFLWRSGKERMTSGIWIYGVPFVRTHPETKEKVAVLLMDTQGMFGNDLSKDLTAAIFGLSTLISSHQIYNIKHQIQDNMLDELMYFTEFSRSAFKAQSKKRLERKEESPASPNSKPKSPPPKLGDKNKQVVSFQALDFLVRDWQNFQNDENIKLCLEEMPEALQFAMQKKTDDLGTREQIMKAFEKIECFLLPHPGTNFTKTSYDGSISAVEENFLQLLDIYIRRLFETRLTIKKIHGAAVRPAALFHYIKAYAEIFKEGRLPRTMTLKLAVAQANNLSCKDEAMKDYRKAMKKVMDTKEFIKPEVLKRKHEGALKDALKMYTDEATFGEETEISAVMESLTIAIEADFEKFEQQNRLRMHASLHRFVLPILAALGCFIVDWVSDFLCDGWSQTCQQLSRTAALCYYFVFAFVAYEFFGIYKSSGSAAMGVSAMALGQATMERFQQLQTQVKEQVDSMRAAGGERQQSSSESGKSGTPAKRSKVSKKTD